MNRMRRVGVAVAVLVVCTHAVSVPSGPAGPARFPTLRLRGGMPVFFQYSPSLRPYPFSAPAQKGLQSAPPPAPTPIPVPHWTPLLAPQELSKKF